MKPNWLPPPPPAPLWEWLRRAQTSRPLQASPSSPQSHLVGRGLETVTSCPTRKLSEGKLSEAQWSHVGGGEGIGLFSCFIFSFLPQGLCTFTPSSRTSASLQGWLHPLSIHGAYSCQMFNCFLCITSFCSCMPLLTAFFCIQ